MFVGCVLLLLPLGRASADTVTVWIGMAEPRYDEKAGIYRTTLDTETGALDKPELAAEIAAPGFLALNPGGTRLYSLCRLPDGEGGIASFEIADGHSLRQLNTQPTGDGEACHLAVDPSAKCLFTAQYGTGSVCAYPLGADGTIGPRTAHVRHTGSGPNRARQEGPHPHWVGTDPTNRYLLVPDLGTDEIVIYRLDVAKADIAPHGHGHCAPGAGPRHMKFHPNGRFVYVINELDLSVTAFRFVADADEGTHILAPFQTITTLPEELREGANSGSQIRIHPSGRFLYAANRGHDSIAAFAIDQDSGRLTFIEREAVRGSHPRNFNIDPTGKWLLAAGRDSNTISLFRIDGESGSLIYTGTTVNSPAPICIEMHSAR
jgi:6-phosphogluconolactonase